MKKRAFTAVLIIGILVIITSCSANTPTEVTRTESSTPNPSPSPTTAPVAAATDTPVSSAAYIIPERPLSQSGPWLLVYEFSGIWALNADGSGLTKIVDWAAEGFPNYSVFLAPNPREPITAVLAYDTTLFNFPVLTLVSLPSGEVIYKTRLLSDSIEAALSDSESYWQAKDIFATVGPYNHPEWSPDGSKLAFNAAIDGDSSDLYVYDVESGTRTRLTSGPTQALEPAWSPDGSTIVQGGAAETSWEMSGYGRGMDAVWAVRADGSGVKQLFTSEIWGDENVLGWTSDTIVLMDTLESFCPYTNLRTIDVETGETKIHWPDGYILRAFDPATDTVLISILENNLPILAECEVTATPGLYLIDLEEGSNQFLEIDLDTGADIQYAPKPGRFFIQTTEDLLTIQADGQIERYPAPERGYDPPTISPDGSRWLFVDKQGRLWMGNDAGDLTSMYAGDVEAVAWSPDGDAFFFLAEEDMFFISVAPEFTPTLVSAELIIPPTGFGDNLIWAAP
jgi:hypothetical protein